MSKIDYNFNPRKDFTGMTFYPWKVLGFAYRKDLRKTKQGYSKYVYFYHVKCVNCGIELIKNKNDFNIQKTYEYKCRNCRCCPKGELGLRQLYKRYESESRKRKIPFHLKLEDFKTITSSNCFYCGKQPTQIYATNRKDKSAWGNYSYNGIDRKNNNDNYNIDNSVPCCASCNRAKFTMSFDEFCDYIKSICDNFKNNCIPLFS